MADPFAIRPLHADLQERTDRLYVRAERYADLRDIDRQTAILDAARKLNESLNLGGEVQQCHTQGCRIKDYKSRMVDGYCRFCVAERAR